MNAKQQYKLAGRAIRTRRYLEDCKHEFHYPVGFDCPCREDDYNEHCENCESESAYRENLSAVMDECKKWLDAHSDVPERFLNAAFKTRRSRYGIWDPHRGGWALGRFLIANYALRHFGLTKIFQDAKKDGNWRWFERQKRDCLENYLPSIRHDLALGYADYDRKWEAERQAARINKLKAG